MRRTTVAKLLYITAHPLDELGSNSMAAGKAFIDSYKDNHSSDKGNTLIYSKKISLLLIKMY